MNDIQQLVLTYNQPQYCSFGMVGTLNPSVLKHTIKPFNKKSCQRGREGLKIISNSDEGIFLNYIDSGFKSLTSTIIENERNNSMLKELNILKNKLRNIDTDSPNYHNEKVKFAQKYRLNTLNSVNTEDLEGQAIKRTYDALMSSAPHALSSLANKFMNDVTYSPNGSATGELYAKAMCVRVLSDYNYQFRKGWVNFSVKSALFVASILTAPVGSTFVMFASSGYGLYSGLAKSNKALNDLRKAQRAMMASQLNLEEATNRINSQQIELVMKVMYRISSLVPVVLKGGSVVLKEADEVVRMFDYGGVSLDKLAKVYRQLTYT